MPSWMRPIAIKVPAETHAGAELAALGGRIPLDASWNPAARAPCERIGPPRTPPSCPHCRRRCTVVACRAVVRRLEARSGGSTPLTPGHTPAAAAMAAHAGPRAPCRSFTASPRLFAPRGCAEGRARPSHARVFLSQVAYKVGSPYTKPRLSYRGVGMAGEAALITCTVLPPSSPSAVRQRPALGQHRSLLAGPAAGRCPSPAPPFLETELHTHNPVLLAPTAQCCCGAPVPVSTHPAAAALLFCHVQPPRWWVTA